MMRRKYFIVFSIDEEMLKIFIFLWVLREDLLARDF